MAKITLLDGTVIEGTIEELRQMGAKFPVEEETATDPKPELGELQVGEYAKVVNNNGANPKFNIGTVLEIIGEFAGAYEYQTLDRSYKGFAYPYRLIKATEEEVAEAKAQVELEAKWAKINRKPNEYKEGDIVRGVRMMGDGRIVEGVVEDLDKEDEAHLGIIPFNEVDGYYAINATELITPVEARFDRDSVQ